jgi:hypothetical protein
MDEDVISVAVSIRDAGRNPIKDLTVKPPTYIRRLMEMCFQEAPADRPSFQEIAEFLLQHAPDGFTVPQDMAATAPIERSQTKPKKGKSQSSSSGSSDESASSSSSGSFKPKQIDDAANPVVTTTKKPPANSRWSQALPKDRDTLIQTMRTEEEMQTNTVTKGYRDVKELHDGADNV